MSTDHTANSLQLQSRLRSPELRSLPEWQIELIAESIALAEYVADSTLDLNDHSPLIFSAAKAYEGFLKHYLLRLNLIDEKTYHSKQFRLGRALNPDVKQSQRDEWWLFDDISRACTPEIAHALWQTWLECRNRLFHYFPSKPVAITLDESFAVLDQIISTIEVALEVLNGY